MIDTHKVAHAKWMQQVMAQAQRYASAWSIAGRKPKEAEWSVVALAAKAELEQLLKQAPQWPAAPVAPAKSKTADYLVTRMIADPRLAWLIGPPSQLFELATEELALQNNANVAATRAHIEAQLNYTPWPDDDAYQGSIAQASLVFDSVAAAERGTRDR